MRKALLFLVAIAVPAAAQDGSEGSASRTPENANRFLTAVFSQDDAGSTTVGVMTQGRTIVADDVIGGEEKVVSGRLDSFTPAGECKSLLRLRDAQIANTDGAWVLGGFERVIDWRKVATVKQTNVTKTDSKRGPDGKLIGEQTVQLHGLRTTMRNNWQTLHMSTASEEERNRAELAIDVLRQGCIIAADTGF
jgi:hypothetical protein